MIFGPWPGFGPSIAAGRHHPSLGHEPQASWVIKMFSVIFEVHPKKEQFDVFQDYHLRVGEIVSDTAPPDGVRLVEQRLDETEVGAGKFATLTEILPAPTGAGSLAPSELADRLSLDRTRSALIAYNVFSRIYNAEN